MILRTLGLMLLGTALMAGSRGEVSAQDVSHPADAAADGVHPLRISLEEATRRALGSSTDVLLAAAVVDETSAQVQSARAARLPQLGLGLQFRWQPTAASAGGAPPFAPDPTAPLEQRVRYLEATAPYAAFSALDPTLLFSSREYGWIRSLTVEQVLWDGGRISASVDAAKAAQDAAESALISAHARTELDVGLAYRQLILARTRVEAARAAMDAARTAADATCAMEARDAASELDRLRAGMEVSALEPRLAEAVAAEAVAEAQLRILVRADANQSLELTTAIDAEELMAFANVEPSALLGVVQAGDLRSAEAAIHAAEAEARSIRASRKPSLALRLEDQRLLSPDQPLDLGGSWSRTTSLSAAIQVPVLAFGRRADERAAEARAEQARIQARQIRDGHALEDTSVRAERTRALTSWEVQRDRLAAAQRAAELTAQALERGVSTEVELARAELDRVEAEAALLESVIDYLNADANHQNPGGGR